MLNKQCTDVNFRANKKYIEEGRRALIHYVVDNHGLEDQLRLLLDHPEVDVNLPDSIEKDQSPPLFTAFWFGFNITERVR